MRKIFFIFALISFLTFGFGVLAQETGLPSPGLTPDSPFYFLERISEEISTFFTFGDLKKAERYATLAAERVAEVQAVVEKGKPEAAEKALKRYEDQLNKSLSRAEKAQAKGKSIEKVAETIAEATGEHLIVIEELLEKVPEEAKVPIIEAKEVAVIGQKNALRGLAIENPERATEINLKAAEARLNRAKAKTEEGETKEVEEAIEEFENQHKFGEEISQIAQGIGKDTTSVEQLVGKATAVHLKVLAEIYEKIPEPAKPAIEEAMAVSVKGHERAVEVLKEKNALEEVPEIAPVPVAFPIEVKARIEKKVKKEIEKECLREGRTYMPGEDKQCCAGLEKMTITYGDGKVCTLPMGYVCTAFCGDGKCEGEYENACSCPEDCPKSEKEEISCTKNSDCGTDTCQQGRDKCIEIKYVCENGKCSGISKEYKNYSCAKIYSPELTYPESAKCLDTCGDGICKSPEIKDWCPEDCPPASGQEPTEKEPVVGGPCSYNTFKGKCEIISILNENVIKFKFMPTEPLNLEGIEWAREIIDREHEEYAGYLGLKCLDKYPITKEDLEKCNIKENAVPDCELGVITSGTCTPIIFKFY